MKNGRALKGHRRIATAINPSPIRNRASQGGWDVSCICGWNGGNWKNSTLAYKAYRAHIDYQLEHSFFTCKRCGVEKRLSEMRPDFRYVCLKCFSEMGNEWQRRNPTISARHKRNHHLLRHFGITVAEAENLQKEQDDLCAICKSPFSDQRERTPHIDHDHETGVIRGVLCINCNLGLGAFKDDPDLLLSAIEYLKRFKS